MTVFQSFKTIPEFPGYRIGSFGEVYNAAHNRWMSLSPTEAGDLTVGLSLNGRQYRRSVKVLVAEAFVDGKSDLFDTPIQLDMNKENLHAENLVWRPRWFAWRYARQFENAPQWVLTGPVIQRVTNRMYEDIWSAAMKNGSLMLDIRWSLMGHKPVFPQGHIYDYVY